MLDRSRAAEAGLRHGLGQMVLFIAACGVTLVLLVVHPEIAEADTGWAGALDLLRPWTTIVVVLVDLWAVVLALLLFRHCDSLVSDRAARSAFIRASMTELLVNLLPGLLIWGWYGLPASTIGLVCLVVTLTFSVRARRSSKSDLRHV